MHQPVAAWEGVIGTQFGRQKLNITGEESLFAGPTTTDKWSLFALEHTQWNDVHFELAARFDQQKIEIDSPQKIMMIMPFLIQALLTGNSCLIINFHWLPRIRSVYLWLRNFMPKASIWPLIPMKSVMKI